jgi:hypothetical protein
MGQLTISRFRGDTAFGFVARIISTFFGGLVGLIMWFVNLPLSLWMDIEICQVCINWRGAREPIWFGGCLCCLLSVFLLRSVVLARAADDEPDFFCDVCFGNCRIFVLSLMKLPLIFLT